MTKNISTLLVLLLTLLSHSQNTILIQNKNPKAKELKHRLNSTKDSLLLYSESKILQIEIFNEDFEKKVNIEAFKTLISLEDVPIGNFVVEVKLTDKIILIDLIKNNKFNYNISSDIKETLGGKGMMLDENLNIVNSVPNESIEFILTRVNTKKQLSNNQKYFWTESKIINKSGSCKTMRLANKEIVDKMILKHQLEIESNAGKSNKLTIWEVYNTKKFMENQLANPDFVYSISAEIFNSNPYYSTQVNTQNLQ
ncbi:MULTISPECIES: hypothetical protein [Winogradskyella]|uniref:hypothetical protein n=1 Tax=Winogradskyella TaxID=286104 RepID=UPI0015CD8AFD|nr:MULTISPECIES: hypothetical protein [Winogradskyella]QXP77745.1 hypothetical protein H0I32_10960 [Winogradskyella sp. HaHa_3_26]